MPFPVTAGKKLNISLGSKGLLEDDKGTKCEGISGDVYMISLGERFLLAGAIGE